MKSSKLGQKRTETGLCRYLGFGFVACIIMWPMMGWPPMLSLAAAAVALFHFYFGSTPRIKTKPLAKTNPKQKCRQ